MAPEHRRFRFEMPWCPWIRAVFVFHIADPPAVRSMSPLEKGLIVAGAVTFLGAIGYWLSQEEGDAYAVYEGPLSLFYAGTHAYHWIPPCATRPASGIGCLGTT